MIKISIPAWKNEIKWAKINSYIHIFFPKHLKQFEKNLIKISCVMLNGSLDFSEKFKFVDNFPTNSIMDSYEGEFFIFSFASEEDAFYFKMKGNFND